MVMRRPEGDEAERRKGGRDKQVVDEGRGGE